MSVRVSIEEAEKGVVLVKSAFDNPRIRIMIVLINRRILKLPTFFHSLFLFQNLFTVKSLLIRTALLSRLCLSTTIHQPIHYFLLPCLCLSYRPPWPLHIICVKPFHKFDCFCWLPYLNTKLFIHVRRCIEHFLCDHVPITVNIQPVIEKRVDFCGRGITVFVAI